MENEKEKHLANLRKIEIFLKFHIESMEKRGDGGLLPQAREEFYQILNTLNIVSLNFENSN